MYHDMASFPRAWLKSQFWTACNQLASVTVGYNLNNFDIKVV